MGSANWSKVLMEDLKRKVYNETKETLARRLGDSTIDYTLIIHFTIDLKTYMILNLISHRSVYEI